MADPRRPVHRPDDAEADAARDIVLLHLLEATTKGSQMIRCSGASFVMIGIGVWAGELCELDPRAASKLFAALSVLLDPSASHAQKLKAEKRRQAATIRLHHAVDLEMNPPAGHA